MPNGKRTFFIADTHFGEDNIRRYENRPFDSVTEMDKALIDNWNKAVTEADEVYNSAISVLTAGKRRHFRFLRAQNIL